VAGSGGSCTSGHSGTPVCTAARGPVRAAAETAPPLDGPCCLLGCQATFLPPVGSATRSNSCGALPHLAAPQGAHTEGTGAAALWPCHWFLSPPIPLIRGFCGALLLLKVRGCAAPADSWGSSPRRPGRPPNRGRRPPQCTGLFGLHLALCGLSFLLAWLRNVMPEGSCVKARPRGAHQQDGPRGLAASAGRRAYQAIGGACACRTRRGRGLAGSVVAACPP
jgi:hypothetical protein